MVHEYARWGYEDMRVFLGICQMLGGIGLIIGFFIPIILLASSLSLTLMMFTAIYVRIKVRDTIIRTLPAVFYFVLNLFITYSSYKLL